MGQLLSLSEVVLRVINRNDDVDSPVVVADDVTLTPSSVTQITHPVQTTTQSQTLSLPTTTT